MPSGGYGVGVCVSKRNCFGYGRFRVTGSVFEEYMPEAQVAAHLPKETGLSTALDDDSGPATGIVVAGALVLVLGCAALMV